jgi:DNA-binding NtrC family response regulator
MANILLIEDDDDIRELMTKILNRAGHSSDAVSDGVTALKRIETDIQSFDLIITDLNVPQLSGPDIIKESYDRNLIPKGLPIIIWSAHSNADMLTILSHFDQPNISFMKKPIEKDEIIAHITAELKKNV